jgi:MULE transposase domain
MENTEHVDPFYLGFIAVLRRENPSVNIVKRDIYNATANLERGKRQRKSPPEALIDRLETEKAEGKIRFEWRRDTEGHIAMLFVADARSAAYLNEHPYILLLDCTYKTNKFDMPLLHVLGLDHHGSSFTIALCFLDQEVAENYMEAVGYLRGLYDPGKWPSVVATDCEPALISDFPAIQTKHVLCYWHISKCLLTNCKALFDTMERREEFIQFFKKVVFSKTIGMNTKICLKSSKLNSIGMMGIRTSQLRIRPR